eukprot:15459428-Alexandrium_andersonii.AAC.1
MPLEAPCTSAPREERARRASFFEAELMTFTIARSPEESFSSERQVRCAPCEDPSGLDDQELSNHVTHSG